jgi:hypothetical protein
LTEPDVAWTDFLLAFECGAFALACMRRAPAPLGRAMAGAFAGSAIASALGGLVHGFAASSASSAYRVLWPSTLLAIIAASAALASGALILAGAGPRWWNAPRIPALALAAAVLAGFDSFALAVGAYVPACLALAYAFARRYPHAGRASAACGGAGSLLAVGAGGLQRLGTTPVPGALSPNAFFHVLQMIALALMFAGSRGEAAAFPQPDE